MADGKPDQKAARVGSTLGRYTVVAELGQGGMATVYLAVMRGKAGFHKLLVLKMLRPALADDPELVASFLAEARLAARLNHPNVVQTFEVGEENGEHVIVMEYLDGAPLNQLVSADKHRQVTMPMILKIVVDALSGLHYAHELADIDGTPLALVHRDISPHNVFVTFDGQVKVLDFGIAKGIRAIAETETGVLKGKLHYMAPEQFSGEQLNRRADIYSVGVTLWELATRQRLWKTVPDAQVMYRVLRGDLPTPRSVEPTIAPELDAIIMKALALNRDDRYATCLELQSELEALIDASGERIDDRLIGRTLSTLLARGRTERKAIIDNQLRRLDEVDSSEFTAAHLPTLTLSRTGYSGAGKSSSGSFPLLSRSASGDSDSHSGLHGPVPASTGGPRAWMVAAAVGLCALGAGAFFLQTRHGPPAPPPSEARAPAAPPSTAPSSAVAGAEAPGVIHITLRASPDAAHLFLDDRPLASNPTVQTFPRDGKVHTLRAEAKDHLPKSLDVLFDRDIDTFLSLERAPAGQAGVAPRPRTAGAAPGPAAPAPTAAATAPTPSATASQAPPSAKKAGRNLDTNIPWE